MSVNNVNINNFHSSILIPPNLVYQLPALNSDNFGPVEVYQEPLQVGTERGYCRPNLEYIPDIYEYFKLILIIHKPHPLLFFQEMTSLIDKILLQSYRGAVLKCFWREGWYIYQSLQEFPRVFNTLYKILLLK